MRIGILAHLRHPIRPPFQGGMEAHAWHLTRGLIDRGHDVTLFAAGDSDPALPLHPVVADHYDRVFPWHIHAGGPALTRHLDAAYAALAPALRGFDVIHNNTLHRYPPRLARRDRLAMVTSLHVPPFEPLDRVAVDAPAPWSLFTVTSSRQMAAWFRKSIPQARVVPNGIDLAAWPFSERGDGSAAWAGRICRNKAPHLAMDAAARAGVKLTLYGAVEEVAYHEAEIVPRLSDRIRRGGHLQGDALAAALGRASVFLFTPDWDEPFGLAAVEAMACGVPVAATDMGAVREVLGEAGIVVANRDPAALGAAIPRAMAISRRTVRARAAALYGMDAMLDAYEALYVEAAEARTADWPGVAYPPHALRP